MICSSLFSIRPRNPSLVHQQVSLSLVNKYSHWNAFHILNSFEEISVIETMSTLQVVKSDAKAGAEVYHGSEICKKKTLELLQEVDLPRGLLPLEGIEECGFVRETGFVWVKRKKKYEYLFKTTGMLSSYAPEVTAYVEKGKMKKITGVKAKDFHIWFTLNEMRIDDPASGMIYVKTSVGVGKTVPIKSFEEEYDKYMV